MKSSDQISHEVWESMNQMTKIFLLLNEIKDEDDLVLEMSLRAGETFRQERVELFVYGYFRLDAVEQDAHYFPLIAEVLFQYESPKSIKDSPGPCLIF